MQYTMIRMGDGTERKISRLVLGSVHFGTMISQDDAFRMMDLYWEAGGNAIDTARVYGSWIPGEEAPSERTIGAWVRARGLEKEVFIMTKGAHPPMEDMHHSRLSREDILFDAERSVEILGLPKIDLYYLHRDDVSHPVSDIMGSLDEAMRKLPIRAIGASNWRAARISEANAFAASADIAPFTASELRWSYVQFPEGSGDDTLVTMDAQEYAAYSRMDLAVMAYSSQGNGLFLKGYAPDLSDLPERIRFMATEENIARYQRLLSATKNQGISPSRFVIRYITEDPHLNALALVGCSRIEQLKQSLEAMEEIEHV